MRYCPKCNKLSFDYDPRFDAHRCFSVDCLFIDYDEEYKGGLLERKVESPKEQYLFASMKA